MTLFRNVVFVAAMAGLVAGIALAVVQHFTTVPLILQAETFESASAEAGPVHAHEEGATPHSHGEEAWAPADGVERFAFNVLANAASGVGMALVLLALSEFAGGIASWRHGIFWGFAGFAAFTLAPGLGLPPELPAMPAADLGARQAWWVGTVLLTASGLALIAFRSSPPFALLSVAMIVAPHVIGAPQPVSHDSPIPAELHHRFVVAVTMTNLVFWLLLGAVSGALRGRFALGGESLQDRLA